MTPLGRSQGNRKRTPRDDVKDLARVEGRERALHLRVVERKTFREIAEALGVHNSTAQDWVAEALRERARVAQETHKATSNAILDEVLDKHVPNVADVDSANVVLKTIDQHAKINGYMADKVIVTKGEVQVVDASDPEVLHQFVEKVRQRFTPEAVVELARLLGGNEPQLSE